MSMSVPPNDRVVFVGPFGARFDDVFELAVAPAADEAGYVAARADERCFVGDVPSRIEEEILHARLVIADLSFKRACVCYEAGVAAGARKPRVYIAGARSELPFNVSTNACLRYGRIVQLRLDLARVLRELLAPPDDLVTPQA